MEYSIKDFWKNLFKSVASQPTTQELEGWDYTVSHSASFVEASLSLRPDHSDLSQPVWMIAASGAVGKSTLAKEICANTNAVYLDLAIADTVAGNYMVGGLVKAGLWDAWKEGHTTLLVDALDEARLRVTQSSFEDFLVDVANVASKRNIPIVLLGRVGIIDEAWLILNERAGLNPPILDIELFNPDQSKLFVRSALNRLATIEDRNKANKIYPHLVSCLAAHKGVYQTAIDYVVDQLTSATSADGRQFAGYAPVLEAVATVIASETNPAKIGDAMKAILQGKILSRVTSEVMLREAGKLAAQLSASLPNLDTNGLYEPSEQLSRLASLIFGTGRPSIPEHLPAEAVAAYEEAVQSLLPQHPFLDSKEVRPSSAVFAACILASALKNESSALSRAAERVASGGPNTPNPFLLDFYRDDTGREQVIPASHVGILFASLESTASAGDITRLSAEGEGALDIEMSLIHDGYETLYEFVTAEGGTLNFGRRLGGVHIDAESTDVAIGEGKQVEMIAPVSIRARTIAFDCTDLIIRSEHPSVSDPVVSIEVDNAIIEPGFRPPVVRSGAKLQVSWADAIVYPWTPFMSDAKEDPDPRVAEAQRALRRLCISFRSHSKGQLARYKGKVEHSRMTKGKIGVELRKALLADGVLTIEGPMYILNPDALGQVVGIGFLDLKLKRYTPASIAYLKKMLANLDGAQPSNN